MRLDTLLSPVNGLFSHMPDTIWGPDFDASLVDIELFTRLGPLEVSPLVKFFTPDDHTLDIQGLANLLHQRYSSNWSRIWAALTAEYDMLLTSTLDETRTIARTSNDLETRDLTDTATGTLAEATSTTDRAVRTGSVDTSDTNQLTHNVTDRETRALTATQADSGTDTETRTDQTDASTREVKALAGSEKTTDVHSTETTGSTKNTGTQTNAGRGTQTGDGTQTDAGALYGYGATGAANSTRQTVNEVRDFADTSNNTRTDNLTQTEAGTDQGTSSSTKTFTGRTDTTDSQTQTEDTGQRRTQYGKTTAQTDTGQVTNTRTGDENTVSSNQQTFNNLTDATTRNGTETTTRNLTDKQAGTVDRAGSEDTTETFHAEGSSPLRTYQALIAEEIAGRSGQGWNFTDLIIRDVQSMITSRIWRRETLV